MNKFTKNGKEYNKKPFVFYHFIVTLAEINEIDDDDLVQKLVPEVEDPYDMIAYGFGITKRAALDSIYREIGNTMLRYVPAHPKGIDRSNKCPAGCRYLLVMCYTLPDASQIRKVKYLKGKQKNG